MLLSLLCVSDIVDCGYFIRNSRVAKLLQCGWWQFKEPSSLHSVTYWGMVHGSS